MDYYVRHRVRENIKMTSRNDMLKILSCLLLITLMHSNYIMNKNQNGFKGKGYYYLLLLLKKKKKTTNKIKKKKVK